MTFCRRRPVRGARDAVDAPGGALARPLRSVGARRAKRGDHRRLRSAGAHRFRSTLPASSGTPTPRVAHSCVHPQGTLARDILQDAKTAPRKSGHGTVAVNCSVDGISFSAHADYPQTQDFVTTLAPKHVILVHGEATEMGRLRKALETRAATDGQRLHLYTPRNTQPVHITHKGEKVARVIGRLARSLNHPSPALKFRIALSSAVFFACPLALRTGSACE